LLATPSILGFSSSPAVVDESSDSDVEGDGDQQASSPSTSIVANPLKKADARLRPTTIDAIYGLVARMVLGKETCPLVSATLFQHLLHDLKQGSFTSHSPAQASYK
jgi:hypothetical protein